MKKIILLLSIFATSFTVNAQWKSTGCADSISSVRRLVNSNDTLYALSYQRFHTSVNGGANWTSIPIPLERQSINPNVWLVPTTAGLYAASNATNLNLKRRINNVWVFDTAGIGRSGGMKGLWAFGNRVFAAVDSLKTNESKMLFTKLVTDNKWTKCNVPGRIQLASTEITKGGNNKFYLLLSSSSSNNGLFETTDGVSFSKVASTNLLVNCEQLTASGNYLYAYDSPEKLIRSSDWGLTWTQIAPTQQSNIYIYNLYTFGKYIVYSEGDDNVNRTVNLSSDYGQNFIEIAGLATDTYVEDVVSIVGYKNKLIISQQYGQNQITSISKCGMEYTLYTVGVNETNFEKNVFKIFPNPAANNLTITFQNKVPQEISIFDLQGNKVKQIEITNSNKNFDIDINDLSNGLYFIGTNGQYTKLFIEK